MKLAKYSSIVEKWIFLSSDVHEDLENLHVDMQNYVVICYIVLLCINFVFLFFIFTANALKNQDGIVYNSIVYFTNHVTENPNGPAPLKLRKIIDMVKNNI